MPAAAISNASGGPGPPPGSEPAGARDTRASGGGGGRRGGRGEFQVVHGTGFSRAEVPALAVCTAGTGAASSSLSWRYSSWSGRRRRASRRRRARAVPVPALQADAGEEVVRLCVVGFEGERVRQTLLGRLPELLLVGDDAEVVERTVVTRVELDRAAVARRGAREILLAQPGVAHGEKGLGVRGELHGHAVQFGQRAVVPPGLDVAEAAVVDVVRAEVAAHGPVGGEGRRDEHDGVQRRDAHREPAGRAGTRRPGGQGDDLTAHLHEAEAAEQQEARQRGQTVTLRHKDGQQRAHVQQHRRGHPARPGPPPHGQEHPGQAEHRRHPEGHARREGAVLAHGEQQVEVVVGVGVPEVRQLGAQQPHPLPGMIGDELARPLRPEGGHLHALERVARLLLGPEDGVLEHPGLVGMEWRGDERIAVGPRVVADVEIDAAVRGQEHGFLRQDVIVQRARRRTREHPADQQRRRPRPGAPRERPPLRAQTDRRQHQRHEEQDVGHHHRHRPHEQAQAEERERPRPAAPRARAQDPPDHEPERADQERRGHEHHRVRLRGHAERPARRRQPADEPAPPPLTLFLFMARAREGGGREAEEQGGRTGFQHLLEEGRQKRLVPEHAVDQRQPVRVARQTVERLVVRPFAGGDALRPVAVEFHVALVGLDLQRFRREEQHAQAGEQRTREHDGGRRQQATRAGGRRGSF